MWGVPAVGLASLLFILGITIGIPVIGIALFRSQVAPRVFGLALVFGGFTHPFMPTSHVGRHRTDHRRHRLRRRLPRAARLSNDDLAPEPHR